MSKFNTLTAEFSFEMSNEREGRNLNARDVLKAATDVMRSHPSLLRRRKDGGLYKQSQSDMWHYVGSPDAMIVGSTESWIVIITAIGGRRYEAHAFKPSLRICPLQSFRALEKQAA